MKRIVWALGFIIICTKSSLSQVDAYHYRFDYWASRGIRYLGMNNPDALIHVSELPYSRQDVIALLDYDDTGNHDGLAHYYRTLLRQSLVKSSVQPGRQNQFELQWRNRPSFSNGYNPNDNSRFESDFVGFLNIKDNLSLYFDWHFDTDGIHDSDFHGTEEYYGISWQMRAAYFQYATDHWSLLVGRDFIHWGPGSTGALLTSGFAPALDMIKFSLKLGKFRYQAFNSMLSRADETEAESQINRYFSGHRLAIRFNKVEVAFNETVMYGGPGEVLDPAYLNPLFSYVFLDAWQVQDRKDNTSLSFEATVYWPKSFRLYAQAMLDEFYLWGRVPRYTAILLGVDWIHSFGLRNLWLNLEYVRTDRWVYNYEKIAPWNRLNYYNSLLGHPIGPDADLIHIAPELLIGKNMVLRMMFDFHRRGGTTIYTPYNSEELDENTQKSFNSGVVEKTSIFNVQLEYAPRADWLFTLILSQLSRVNTAHVAGDKSERFAFYLGLQHNLQTTFALK